MRTLLSRFILGSAMAMILVSAPAANAAHVARGEVAGHVYVLANQSTGNQVLAYDRQSDGTISFAEAVSTGGLGTSTGTGSQGSLAITSDGAWLLSVNPGSDSISSLAVEADGLHLADTAPSGGDLPVSVAVHGNVIYALNQGSSMVSGFTLADDGTLLPIPNSTMALSGGGVTAAQVAFDPSGSVLVVTERISSLIDTFRVLPDGSITGPRITPSSGKEPFGFQFDPAGHLIVSETFFGAPDAGAVSSYGVSGGGRLSVITGTLGDTETAACWIAITEDGDYAYATNTGSGTVSGYAIHGDGSLSLLDANGVTAFTGRRSAPIDEDVSDGSEYLYVNQSGMHEIGALAIHADGSLTGVQQVSGLPAGAVGLIAT
jgi:6-phosphogluconolactonase (cycloisomerase 2 family)